MAVAPLVLCKYFAAGVVTWVTVWLAVIGAMWAFMAPSRDEGEHSPDARRRLLEGVLGDPCAWVSLLVVAYAAMVALNGGVALVYDSEGSLWKLAKPAFASLPGCVSGTGGVHFAAAVVVAIVYMAVVHSLDSHQAVVFALCAVLAVVADALFAVLSGVGIGGDRAAAYAAWSLVAAAVMFAAERSGWRFREMLATLALAGCLSALMLSRCATVVWVTAFALPVFAAVFAVFASGALRLRGILRTLVLLLVSIGAAVVVFHWRCGDWSSMVPVWRSAADATLTRLAVGAWESNPWAGVGLGGFPIAAKLAAESADWTVLGALPAFYGCGWRAFLVERGMIGILTAAVLVGAVGFMWFRRARLRGREFFTAALPLLPLAAVVFSVCMVFDGSALQADALVAVASLAALSVNGGV